MLLKKLWQGRIGRMALSYFFLRAQLATQAALQKLTAATRGLWADDGSQQLFHDLAKAVTAESALMIGTAQQASARIQDPQKKQVLNTASGSLDGAQQNFAKITEVLPQILI